MNNLSTEKLVTTKELAEKLNTSSKVILENAKKCLPNKIIQNGKPTYWNEYEITVLIEQLKSSNPNQYTFTGAVKDISTELTPALKIHQAMLLMKEGYEEEIAILEAKKKEQEQRAEVAENKNALLMHSEKSYTISEIAKELGYKSAIEFNKILHKDEIIFKQNSTWIPYAKYSTQGYFEIKQTILDDETVVYNLRVTQKGRIFLLNKYSDECKLIEL